METLPLFEAVNVELCFKPFFSTCHTFLAATWKLSLVRKLWHLPLCLTIIFSNCWYLCHSQSTNKPLTWYTQVQSVQTRTASQLSLTQIVISLDIFQTWIVFLHAHPQVYCIWFHQYQFIHLRKLCLKKIWTDRRTAGWFLYIPPRT